MKTFAVTFGNTETVTIIVKASTEGEAEKIASNKLEEWDGREEKNFILCDSKGYELLGLEEIAVQATPSSEGG